MPAILTIGKTELKYGYFYLLHNAPLDDSFIGDDWVRSPSPIGGMMSFGNCTVVGSKSRVVERFKCSMNPAHGNQKELYDYEVDLTNAPMPIPPFVTESDHVIVNDWLADRLKSSHLKGFRLLPAEVGNRPSWYKDDATTPLAKMFQLTFDGRNALAMWHVEPASANKCPFCGATPIVCPECGFCTDPCVKCGEQWSVMERRYKGETDRRIKFEKVGSNIEVVDPRRWDGSDFMGSSHGGRITRRALDWLLSIHAGPFIAQPIPANVFGLTKAELEHLELAWKPLTDVKPPPLGQFSKKPRE